MNKICVNFTKNFLKFCICFLENFRNVWLFDEIQVVVKTILTNFDNFVQFIKI